MAMLEMALDAPSLPLPSASDMYLAGYRARKTGKRTGEVIDPTGNIYRLNTIRETCSCRKRDDELAFGPCIHLKRYIGLRCEHNARACAPADTEENTFEVQG